MKSSRRLLVAFLSTAILSPIHAVDFIKDVQPILELTRMMNEHRQFEFVTQFIQAEADRQKSAIDKILSPNNR